MTTADGSTLPAFAAPTVLAIGCPPELVARSARALEGIGVALRTCDFLNAATAVAERRPLVLLLLEDLYRFDPEEFDALARDVRASLVRSKRTSRCPSSSSCWRPPSTRRRPIAASSSGVGRGRRRPVLEKDDREMGRRTQPNPALLAYHIGQRLPSRVDLAAVAWPSRSEEPPSSRPGTL